MRFDDPHAFIDQSFTGETHVHQILVQLLSDIAVGTRSETRNLLEIRSQKSVSGPGKTDHDASILILIFSGVEKLEFWLCTYLVFIQEVLF